MDKIRRLWCAWLQAIDARADEVNIPRGVQAGNKLTFHLLDNGNRCAEIPSAEAPATLPREGEKVTNTLFRYAASASSGPIATLQFTCFWL